jgi:PAS domain S-box-containing protein
VHSKVHKALLDSLTARFDNVLIAMRLEEEKLRVERANRALEQEALDRKKAERAELLALQRLRLHLERTPLGVIEWDMEFRVATWNPAAEAIFGYAATEVIGESGYLLVDGKHDQARGRNSYRMVQHAPRRRAQQSHWRGLTSAGRD